MLPSRSAISVLSGCPIAAVLFACGSVDLQATALIQQQSPPPDVSCEVLGSATFYVAGRRLCSPCGDPVVLRGVNEMVTYIGAQAAEAAFSEIARTNANSVRIYWHTSDSADDLDRVLSEAEAQRLIPIVYAFNGGGSEQDHVVIPTSLSQAADYWTGDAVKRVVAQHQSWLVIALREKSEDVSQDASTWASRYDPVIARVRAAAINVPLAIDAPLAGSDVETLLSSSGPARIAADPLHNLLLNVNAGGSSDTGEKLAAQLNRARAAILPLLIGEVSGFSHTADYGCAGPYDYSAVLAAAEKTQMGWLGWSWGLAKNQYCSSLDMTTDGTFSGLGDWGLDAAVTNENSISRTSRAPQFAPGSSTCEPTDRDH
jgi:mannan endo-1,4-beta-mannosidase